MKKFFPFSSPYLFICLGKQSNFQTIYGGYAVGASRQSANIISFIRNHGISIPKGLIFCSTEFLHKSHPPKKRGANSKRTNWNFQKRPFIIHEDRIVSKTPINFIWCGRKIIPALRVFGFALKENCTLKPYLKAVAYENLGDRQQAEGYYLRSYKADPDYFWCVVDLPCTMYLVTSLSPNAVI